MKKTVKKIMVLSLCVLMLLPVLSCGVKNDSDTADVADISQYIINESDIPLMLQYNKEAPVTSSEHESEATWYSDVSWERESLPIGNGYFGANVFGRTDTERIQITEKTLANPHWFAPPYGICKGGLNNFSETFIDFGHKNNDVINYTRYLDLKTAISGVEYTYDGVTYSREYFTSYPDKALVIRLDADTDGALNFTLRPNIPFEQDYMEEPGDGLSKHGTVTSKVEDGIGQIELSGKMGYYDIDFLGLYKVYTNGGQVTATYCINQYGEIDGTITVSGANSAYIVVTLGTDYELTSEIFTSDAELNESLRNEGLPTYDTTVPTFKTTLEDTRVKVEGEMAAIEQLMSGKSFDEAYNALKNRHINDYSNLFGRVTLDINCSSSDFALTTDKLLAKYKNGSKSSYFEALLFQYGRYMLIASSRENTLPANLQGVWNTYNSPAWSSGYWHNINVQMNYWPAFSTNLAETFEGYINYNQAYMEATESLADLAVIKSDLMNNFGKDGGNGWVIGVAATPFKIYSDTSSGNLGFTTQMFWDYYEYTQDKTALKEIVYPVLYSAAQFITKIVVEDENGNYLVAICDSPEQYVDGSWYYTSGTTYAQSFAYLNNYNLLCAAKELGIEITDSDVLSKEENAVLVTVLEQIDKYDPIIVGLSGQIKEFREEKYYGNLGQWQHRHISHLSGLVPGNIINSNTPAWIDASKVVLTERGDASGVGWALAYQMGLWARTGEGNKSYQLLDKFITDHITNNLWDLYDSKYNRSFQIEANFGATSSISEMLLQSNTAGYIEPLAALPDAWDTGSYTGLVARGNFEVSAAWKNGVATSFNILSKSGGRVSVKYPSVTGAVVRDENGQRVNYTVDGNNLISFDTEAGKTYVIYGFKAQNKLDAPRDFSYVREGLGEFNFTWSNVEGATKYNVYVAVESQSDYTLIGSTSESHFNYLPNDTNLNARMTFVVTAVGSDSFESKRTICYYNPIETVDGITIDGIKEDNYGTTPETVLLDGDRSYTTYAIKTESGVFIYSQGIFNTCADDFLLNSWTDKTNFEFRLNGGKQSYVNVLKQFSGTTHFSYDVEKLSNGKYQHTVEIFVDKELITNWSDTENVQFNYAWKTPTENARMISEAMDYRYADWNTDWHSYHKYGGLSTYYMPIQANLFVTENGFKYVETDSSFDLFEGKGTQNDPYLIQNAEDMWKLSELTKGHSFTDTTVYFKLTADINLSAENWQPICASADTGWVSIANCFYGNFDGNGKTITFVGNYTGDTWAKGLFSAIGGYVHDLTLRGSITTEMGRVGSLASMAFSGAKIENITSYVNITAGNNQVGGIIGYIQNDNVTIKNCKNYGTITGNELVGGILGGGYKNTSFINCENHGNITATFIKAGGIAGEKFAVATMTNCTNGGKVVAGGQEATSDTGSASNYAGYLIGIAI